MEESGRQTHARTRFTLLALCFPLFMAALLSVAIPKIATAAVVSAVAGGVLTVTSDAADPITITCDAGFVKVNGADPGSGAAACNTITAISVTGGPGDNTIDLNAVNGTDFPALLTVTLSGGDGSDTILGSALADTLNGDGGDDRLVGFRGNDIMNGGPGSDTLVWNNGDGSDVMNGDDDADTVEVNGAPAGDIFEIAPNGTRVAFERTNLGLFTLDIDAEALEVNGGDGDDVMTGTTGLAGLIVMTLNGGNGNDQITGGDGVDILNGDAGDDTLIGAKGNDIMNGGPGNDTLIWNNGDNSDTMNGDDDADTVQVNGAPVGDAFEIGPNGARVTFTRTNLIPFVLDIDAEALEVNGGDGDDVMTGTVGLAGLIAMTLNGGNGNDQITGGDGVDILNGDDGDDILVGFRGNDIMNGGPGNDTLIWNNGDNTDVMNGDDGDDTVQVNGAPVGDIFEIAPNGARVTFTRTNLIPFVLDIDAEALEVNGGDGDDVMTGTVGLAGLIAMTLNGGNGNDQITGGDGVDILNGDAGDDTLIGAKGDDIMNGGPGNDTLIWNNGDNSDTMNGDDDADTVQVNGAPVGDAFEIGPNGARVTFTRTNLIPFVLDIDAEALQVNGGDGDDVMTGTTGLASLIAMTLSGGNGNDLITGGDGADTLNGDAGDDTLVGFRGNDIMNGGPGNDTLIWNNGDGSDTMNGDDDNDTVEVNGAPAGDIFEIKPNGERVAFNRTNLGLFSLDIDAEALEVNGGDGDDTFNVWPLLATRLIIDGGANEAGYGDALWIDAQNRWVAVVAGLIQIQGAQVIEFSAIEQLTIQNRHFPLYLPRVISAGW